MSGSSLSGRVSKRRETPDRVGSVVDVGLADLDSGTLLLDKRELGGIQAGEVSLVFRRWRSPRVKIGTRLRTPIGLVEVLDLAVVTAEEVTEEDARDAGFPDLTGFRNWLDERPGDLYRIRVRAAGPDPRVELRQRTDLEPAEVEELRTRLERMDRRADEPWTWETLRLIHDNPGRVSTELAELMELPRPYFKQRVRRLKELGLTESLEVGYRISPRGRALLDHGD